MDQESGHRLATRAEMAAERCGWVSCVIVNPPRHPWLKARGLFAKIPCVDVNIDENNFGRAAENQPTAHSLDDFFRITTLSVE